MQDNVLRCLFFLDIHVPPGDQKYVTLKDISCRRHIFFQLFRNRLERTTLPGRMRLCSEKDQRAALLLIVFVAAVLPRVGSASCTLSICPNKTSPMDTNKMKE